MSVPISALTLESITTALLLVHGINPKRIAMTIVHSSLSKLTFIKTNKVLEQQRLLVEGVTILPKYDCFPNTKHIAPEASEMNLFSLRDPIASGDMCLQLRNGMSPILLKWAGSRSFSLRVLMNLVITVTAFRTITVSHLRRKLHWSV
ncbi:hypothetical protein CDAR_408081 [Caerostris darwini]|uniref:Uncharacterized protein n=1 Tax=Caerostris darwini TaxID=1538125 RepID=A0AAV4TKW0_9ARAC|nr:hypothetical protein CDAR_408081 [Caerostris darwini]